MPNHDQQGHIDASKPTTQPALESSPAKSKKPSRSKGAKTGAAGIVFCPEIRLDGPDPAGDHLLIDFESFRHKISAMHSIATKASRSLAK